MPVAVTPLSELAERLALKETELTEVRRAFEARLEELRRRKEELESQLRLVDLEIQSATQPSSPPAPPPAVMAPTPITKPVPASSGKMPPLSIPQLLLSILREKQCPMTVKELAQEVERREFPTHSANLPKMIGSRVAELIGKGYLVHAPGNVGVILAPVKSTPVSNPPAAKTNGKATGVNGHAAANGKPKTPPVQTNTTSLNDLLTNLLTKSAVPLKTGQLAEQALAAGFKTSSKYFNNVVSSALGQMDHVEKVEGKGYRLKKRSAKSR